VRSELQTASDGLGARGADLAEMARELADAGAQLASRTAERSAADTELEALRSELAAREAQLSGAAAELDARRAELAGATAEIDALRHELDAVQGELQITRVAAEDVRAEREQARLRATQLLGEAERARAAAEAIRAEFAFDIAPPIVPAAAQPFARRMPYATSTPFAGPAAVPAQPAAPGGGDEPTPELPPCEAGIAAALIGLDGRFQRLDDAFSSLLGCREDELRGARWPSIIDRDNHKAHQEIARALRAGEIESADVETIYMHAGGLLVPVEGTVTLRRDAAGEPTHFLFRADVRRTSGASR
jgi:PAS domain S-box-containing protein